MDSVNTASARSSATVTHRLAIFAKWLRAHLRLNWGMLAAVVFFLLMSTYSAITYQNGYFTLFDLGLDYRLSLTFSHTLSLVPWSNGYQLLAPIPNAELFYVVVAATLWLHNSPVTLLIDQTAVISLGGYAVFQIARNWIGGTAIALAVEIAYFLYPSTYGYLAHGGNIEVYFEGLFLAGYMFYVWKRKIPFLALTILAAMTSAWAPVVLLAFYALETVYRKGVLSALRQRLSAARGSPERAQRAALPWRQVLGGALRSQYALLGVVVASLGLLAFSVHSYPIPQLLSATRLTGTSGGGGPLSTGINSPLITDKFTYISNTLTPLLYTPLLSPYAVLILVYYALLIVVTNNPTYYDTFQQYPYIIVGILFIGTLDFFRRLKGVLKDVKFLKRVLVVVLVASVISFAILSPFGVGAWQSGEVSQSLTYTPVEQELNHMYSLVPRSASVFLQNDMPQLMNAAVIYAPEYYNNQTVDFAVINPLNFNSIAAQYSGYSEYWANHFANNSSYGIYAQVQTATVFKLGYSGPPVYFVPLAYGQEITSSFTAGQALPNNEYWASSFPSTSPNAFTVFYSLLASNCSDLPQAFAYEVADGGGATVSVGTASPACSMNSTSVRIGFTFVSHDFGTGPATFRLLSLNNFSQGTFELDDFELISAPL
jgi:uncharacterized membrane protein